MPNFPPEVSHELEGWILFWADLVPTPCAEEHVAQARADAAARARSRLTLETLAGNATAAAVRRLFRAAGCDPTRYRPSSEALLRRVLKGDDLPAISPIVDLNNCLSLDLVVPACVMDVRGLEPPFTLRQGRPQESMISMRGPFELDRKPTLADARGPFGTPITDSERVRVTPQTGAVWLVAYLPKNVVLPGEAETCLRDLLAAAPVARVVATAHTPA